MADFSSRIMMSSEHPTIGGGPAGKAILSSAVSGSGNRDVADGMDQISVVRIDDEHIAEEQSDVGGKVKDTAQCYEVEYLMPAEEVVVGEEEEDDVYVIEYSNPEEEGESYKFTMSVDRSLPTKKPIIKHPLVRESARAPLPVMTTPAKLPMPVKPRDKVRRKKRKQLAVEKEANKLEVLSNTDVLKHGENYRELMGLDSSSDKRELVCTLCPPPGKHFKRAAGLAVHLKHMHHMEGNKTFFCTKCEQTVRTQIALDAHTKRHANQEAVFTCLLCSAETDKTGYKGTRWGLKKHLETEHPGIIPRCNICNKGFKSLVSYLGDQFRHVGVSPYYCAQCQIYEMTERGLSVHIKNHDKKKKREQLKESGEINLQTFETSANVGYVTDDSDF
ncbi:hypothetical protein ABVT39_013486 [Epinephelus coioides]